jgi:hypothetical protein
MSDIIWGAPAIGAVIGLSPSQTYHHLANGYIKSARKKGGRWCASRAELLREHGAAELVAKVRPPEIVRVRDTWCVVGHSDLLDDTTIYAELLDGRAVLGAFADCADAEKFLEQLQWAPK